MVAGVQQRQQQQQGAPTSTSSAPPPAEEDVIKRNTDCVYFLASPLTCKKGSECEYRHSEYARVNPRDCWFWLHGNCLNPKCSFRHPPLDGLSGPQVVASASSAMVTSQTAVMPAAPAPYNLGKQSVPCIFFQKGLCLKGDRCSFLHAPSPTSNKASQVLPATPGSEPLTLKKNFGCLEKSTQEKKVLQASISKSVEMPPVAKPASKTETAPPRNEVGIERNIPPPTGLVDQFPRYRAANVHSVVDGNSVSRSNHFQTHVLDDHGVQNGKDADEFLRESSPGFDVLVDDDELGDTDYYRSEDQYGRTRGHEGHSADYSSIADVDREMLCDSSGYDSFDHLQGQYDWEQQRVSSEGILGVPALLERRGYPKAESSDRFTESDLRHRLSKQRRVNGLRSVVSHDYALENHVVERNYQGSSRRDSSRLPSHENTLSSSRLRGRIKLPGRSSPVDGSDLRPDREMDRRRNRARSSPGRPQSSLHQGRLRDRIKGRVQEDYNNEERSFRGLPMRKVMDDRNSEFAAPRRLAELKTVNNVENKEQQSLGKRRNLMNEDHQQFEGDLSFEGPKPLSVILKRKREAEVAASRGGVFSFNKEENNQKESKGSLISSSKTAVTEKQIGLPTASKEEANSHVIRNKEESKFAMANAVETEEKTEAAHGQSSQVPDVSEYCTEDGEMVDEAMGDPALEEVEQRDGDYDYEQGDEGDYNFDVGENLDPEEEFLEDEYGDDFAKKIGVMFM